MVLDRGGLPDVALEEEPRSGLIDQAQEGGLGGLATGLAGMVLPQAGLPGQRSIGDVFTDFVEFSRLGDVLDLGSALDPNSGLDPLERLVAAAPFIGVGAIGVRQGYKRYAARAQQAQGAMAHSMNPPQGQAFDLSDPGFEELGGIDPTGTQLREQQAKFEQLSFESKSPFSRGVLRAESWEELIATVDSEAAVNPNRHRVADAALRGVGLAVVNNAPDPTLYGVDPEAAQFIAAKVALAKWNRAIDLGLIKEPDLRQPGLGSGATERLLQMIHLEIATSGIVGPDLSMPSPGRLARIVTTEGGETQVIYGIVDELLPTERVFDWDVMYPVDEGRVHKRQSSLDMEAMEGLYAANIAKGVLQAPPSMADSGRGLLAKDQGTFYKAMNQTARVLSDATPYSVTQVSGVISGLSSNTAWAPENLVGAVHTVLQTGRPDLDPMSAEYQALFREATVGSGWGQDLFESSGQPVREQFEQMPGAPGGIPDFEGVAGHYGNPENVTGPHGIMGADETTKIEKAEMILKGNLPPWLVLRGMKTNTFSRSGADPSLRDLVTVDRHSDRLSQGSVFVTYPLAHQGVVRGEIDPTQTYHDPITGDSITGEGIRAALDAMEEHGWSPEQVMRWRKTLASFPTKQAQARYLAQSRAHLLVRDELGLETGQETQAMGWAYARENMGRTLLERRLSEAKTIDEFRAIAEAGTLDPAIFSHLEGNPVLERTAAGMVWEVDDTLAGALPTVEDLHAAGKGVQRPASGRVTSSILAVRNADGRVTPYADATKPGVAETLRHATPTGIRVGDFERYISNKPRQVLSAQDHVAEAGDYLREDGRQAAGFATIGMDPASPGHPGMLPGNRAVVLVPQDRVSDIQGILEGDWPLEYQVGTAQGTRLGLSRNKLDAEDLAGLTDDQLGELLKNNDWGAISSDNIAGLRADVRRMGGQFIDAEGSWLVEPQPTFTNPTGERVNQEIAQVAEEYMDQAGLDYEPALLADEVNEKRAMKIADAYDALPEFDPASRESYEAMAAEVKAQYEFLVGKGYEFTFGDDTVFTVDPTGKGMFEDIRKKKLNVYGTEETFTPAEFRKLQSQNPLFRHTGTIVDGRNLTFNDMFRAIHDVFGHARNSNNFSTLGEENAWRTHMAMFSKKAQPAMTAETRGQNSALNAGPARRTLDGKLIKRGDPGYLEDAPFPPQKAALLPDEFNVVEKPPIKDTEASLFVTGLSYADLIKLGKKHGQMAIATRSAMLNTDGTYNPVQDKVSFGDSANPDSNTRLATGQKFSFDYDFSEALPLPLDPDTLADVGSQAEPMAQVTIDMGGDYGGLNWNVTSRMLRKVAGVPGARPRVYSHAPNQVPAGFTKASESVFTDAAGVTGSILHRSGDRYARHQADVWIPEWESHTLSQDGFEGERTRRGAKDARDVMEVDQEAGMIWFDKDLAISVPPDADVSLGKAGSIFRSLRINGTIVREMVVDTNGPVPILVAGEAGVPGPGRTVVTLSNGVVSKITPHTETDLAPARDALAGAGLIPDGEKVAIEYLTEDDATANVEATSAVFHDALPVVDTNRFPWSSQDRQFTAEVRETVPTLKKISFGRNATDQVRGQARGVLEGLHGAGSRFSAFQAKFGSLPVEIWEGSAGIDTAVIADKQYIDAVTLLRNEPVIILNESVLARRWAKGVKPKNSNRYSHPEASDFEETLVHEIGHMLWRHFPDTKTRHAHLMDAFDVVGVNEATGRMLVSPYGYQDWREFFAEAFARSVFEPDKVHPALANLVSIAMNNARSGVEGING